MMYLAPPTYLVLTKRELRPNNDGLVPLDTISAGAPSTAIGQREIPTGSGGNVCVTRTMGDEPTHGQPASPGHMSSTLVGRGVTRLALASVRLTHTLPPPL